jgi:hypothetical protein
MHTCKHMPTTVLLVLPQLKVIKACSREELSGLGLQPPPVPELCLQSIGEHQPLAVRLGAVQVCSQGPAIGPAASTHDTGAPCNMPAQPHTVLLRSGSCSFITACMQTLLSTKCQQVAASCIEHLNAPCPLHNNILILCFWCAVLHQQL